MSKYPRRSKNTRVADVETFGGRLRLSMLMRDLSVAAVAKGCAVSRQTVSHWLTMRDARLSGTHLMALSGTLKVRSPWLALNEGGMTADAPKVKRT